MKVLLTLMTLLALSLGSAEEYPIFDFSGGQNTTLFPTVIADNEAVLIRNLIFENGVLKGRYGFGQYNTNQDSLTGGLLVAKGLHRSKNGRFYLAWNGFLWKNIDTTATSSQFKKVDSSPETLASANYVSFADYSETTYVADGRNFYKTVGDSLMAGNEVWRGQVSLMVGDAIKNTDTVDIPNSSIFERALINKKSNIRYGPRFAPIGVSGGSPSIADTVRFLFKIDLEGFEIGDSILAAVCSLYVQDEASTTDETLMLHRLGAFYSAPSVNWSNQPAVAAPAIDSEAVAAPGTWLVFTITDYVDSIVRDSLVNYGLRISNRDEVNSLTSKTVVVDPGDANGIRVNIRAIRKTQFIDAHPRIIIDTTAAGLWDINRWQGYYVEFLSDTASVNGDYVRLIDSTRFDSLFLDVPLIDPKWQTTRRETYRIMAFPASIDNIFTGKVDSLTTVSITDSTRRIWVGVQSIDPSTYKHNRYFFKVTSGLGEGIHQILYGGTTSTQDWFVIFSPRGAVFDSTTRFSIFQTVFPPVKYITVRGNRAYFAGDSLHPNWMWYSEPKVLGEVGGLNFIPIGGEPAEGNITSLRPLFVSNYSDPRNPLIIYKAQSVHALFGSDPATDVPIKILDKIGTVSDRSVISVVDFGQAFQGSDGNFYVTDGQNIKLLSAKIQGNVNQTNLTKTTSFYLKRNINWSISNKTLTYNIDNGAWTEQNFRFGPATHLNLATDTLRPYNIAFTHTDSGKVYIFGNPNIVTDPGSVVITPTIKTKWYSFGDPTMIKHLTRCWYQANADNVLDSTLIMVARDSSGILSATLVDTLKYVGFTGDLAVMRYFPKRVTAKMFQFTLQTAFASTFRLGGLIMGYQNYKKEGY